MATVIRVCGSLVSSLFGLISNFICPILLLGATWALVTNPNPPTVLLFGGVCLIYGKEKVAGGLGLIVGSLIAFLASPSEFYFFLMVIGGILVI